MLVLGKRPDWGVFAGKVLIFVGLVSIDGRLLSRFARLAWRPHQPPRALPCGTVDSEDITA